mgnify:CR=1 FL=1|jgi:hypothetical protein|tara:strand:+ start:392 stop:670 length:279 start_codon:yes stop_codon:yes gene_type:complete
MQSYLSGRGTSIENVVSVDGSNSFSPYLSDPSKQHDNMPKSEVIQNDVNSDTEVVHEDESGIKIEVVSVEGVPTNLIVHIPDGRVIDIGCVY